MLNGAGGGGGGCCLSGDRDTTTGTQMTESLPGPDDEDDVDDGEFDFIDHQFRTPAMPRRSPRTDQTVNC